jgi:hypothetical protein
MVIALIGTKLNNFIISTHIKGLVFNSGSWKTDELSKVRFKRLKHVAQQSSEWKLRLESNIH